MPPSPSSATFCQFCLFLLTACVILPAYMREQGCAGGCRVNAMFIAATNACHILTPACLCPCHAAAWTSCALWMESFSELQHVLPSLPPCPLLLPLLRYRRQPPPKPMQTMPYSLPLNARAPRARRARTPTRYAARTFIAAPSRE